MGKTIVIAEQSEVIRKGLVNIIGTFDLFDSIHELPCNLNIEASVARIDPDILIINPVLVNSGLTRWLNEYRNGEMKIAAIVYTLFDDELIRMFDEVIQVGDTRLKIRNKLNKLLAGNAGRKLSEKDMTLSEREKEVVRLLAKGMSNKEISDQLYISPHTVITHRRNITRKLNIKSVAGLIVYAIINEIVSVDELQGE